MRVFVLKEKEKGYIPSARDTYLISRSLSNRIIKIFFNLKFKLVCPFTLCELNAIWPIRVCVLCICFR